MMNKMFIVIMGVSGCGKTTIGKLLAESLKGHFLDADDYHDKESVAMMQKNIPLTDNQRIPWVKRLIAASNEYTKKKNVVVLGYSGLKCHHRDMFRDAGLSPSFFWLDVSNTALIKRLTERENHFVDAGFLKGQLAAFETPLKSETDIVKIQADNNYAAVLAEINQKINNRNNYESQ